ETVLLGVEDSGAAYLWDIRARAAWAERSRRLQEKKGAPGESLHFKVERVAYGPRLPHGGAVTSVAFAPGGRDLLTASADGTARRGGPARVWRRADALPDPRESGAPWGGHALAWAADGGTLAFGCGDGKVHLRDAAGRRGGGPLSHPQRVTAVVFAGDGTVIT